MNPKLFKAMQAKKKRAVDPNAPPRPNLMTHDVKIKDQQFTIDSLARTVYQLTDTVRRLDNKLKSQQQYLQYIHSKIIRSK
jgi:hypothetical protein